MQAFRGKKPSRPVVKLRTSAIERAKLVHTIELAKDTYRGHRRYEKEQNTVGNSPGDKSSAMPRLFPNLKSFSFSSGLLAVTHRLRKEGKRKGSSANGVLEKDYERKTYYLWRVCGALALMVQPANMCIHIPTNVDDMDVVNTTPLTMDFFRRVNWPVVLYHNYPLDDGTEFNEAFVKAFLHIRPRSPAPRNMGSRYKAIYKIILAKYMESGTNRPLILHDVLPSHEQPDKAALQWSKPQHSPSMGRKWEQAWAGRRSKLPADSRGHCVESLDLPSSFAKSFWDRIGHLNHVAWNRDSMGFMYSLLKDQLFCLPVSSKSVEGVCLMCGRE